MFPTTIQIFFNQSTSQSKKLQKNFFRRSIKIGRCQKLLVNWREASRLTMCKLIWNWPQLNQFLQINQGFLYVIFWIVSKIRIKKIHQYWISQENGSPSGLMRELTPKYWIRSITLPVDIMFPTVRDYLNMWILILGHLKEEIACFFKACQCCQDKIFFCTGGLIFPEEGLPLRFTYCVF